MNVPNIDRLLCFAKDGEQVMGLDTLQGKYGFEPDGTNFYYGINSANRDRFQIDGNALSADFHQPFFDNVLASLDSSAAPNKTVVLGLEPLEPSSPFVFANQSGDLLRALATELAEYQNQARQNGKALNVVIRYASEMNVDPREGNPYAGDPEGYKAGFQFAKTVFQGIARDLLFSFSPAIRADLDEADLSSYWPGTDFVDIVGGTWYIGSEHQSQAAASFMQRYFLHRVATGKPCGIDELGGCSDDPNNRQNDQFIRRMLEELASLQNQAVGFRYVTVFLEGKWGEDATLAFLR
jgi:hypothetical protein